MSDVWGWSCYVIPKRMSLKPKKEVTATKRITISGCRECVFYVGDLYLSRLEPRPPSDAKSTSQAPSRHNNYYQIVSSNNMHIEKQFHKLYVEVNLFNLWFFKYQIKITVSNWHSSLGHEFGSPEVTKIVTDRMHNFLLFHMLQQRKCILNCKQFF
ncbi:hypothetical protein C5167_043610 [Papaver somniferum]|uniref:Uncharacterized protein n=1 Tax=Papaver somniferum TaxID=3469 RepID=A0A4Y7L8S0_PAPSO|nr:hypothetical protein C5167_043610 [Papaver somniferum]